MSYEEEQSRLLKLLQEVDTEEEFSDDEEDVDVIDYVEKRAEDSETEQEADSETEGSVGPHFMGKDGITKWNKHPPSQRVRTRKSNLVVRLPLVKGIAREAKSPLDCWKLFFTEQMLNYIVDNTNRYIDSSRYGVTLDYPLHFFPLPFFGD